jgi:hypothetical protein
MLWHFANIPVPVRVRRHVNAKKMVLRLSPQGDELRLTLPQKLAERHGKLFVQKQRAWIVGQVSNMAEAIPFEPDITLPLFGQNCRLIHHATQRGTIHQEESEKGSLAIGGQIEFFHHRVEQYIYQQAKQRFGLLAQQLSSQLDVRPASVTIKDTHSRWGSCSSKRRINLSWRLAFAPQEVAHYVVAHEVSHLKHMDHSPAFWQTVAELQPDYEAHKDWLRKYGKELHRYGKKG